MKNIHLLPTDKPSRLYKTGNFLLLDSKEMPNNTLETKNQHLYITCDEEIKDVRPHKGKWQLEEGNILNKFPNYLTDLSECKLIILTTDPDLIKDGVQAIDDEFLEWFVKNPSCESVHVYNQTQVGYEYDEYHFILPEYNPKQEKLEEAAENYVRNEPDATLKLISKYSFKDGAKWQAERMYSGEEVFNLCREFAIFVQRNGPSYKKQQEWFEQFKKK